MIDQVKWDRRWLIKAMEMASFSKDPSTRVGAIVVNEDNEVVGTGYNGFPKGVVDSDERLFDREVKYKFMCHAEQNAIWTAGRRAKGGTIYVWPTLGVPPCCNECAKAVIQSGIKRVVGFNPLPEDGEKGKRWDESRKISEMMLKEAGVEITEVPV